MGDTPKKNEKTYLFGFSWFHPKSLQFLASFIPFMIILSLNGFFQGAIVNGLISTSISSIEKRFDLTSTQSGIFAATYDVFVTAGLLPLALYAKRVIKVRCIGWGMIFVGIGSLLILLPEIIAGKYTATALKKEVCDPKRVANLKFRSFLLLLLSQAFTGIGASPLFTYGFSCIDEFDGHARTGRNMAIYMSATTIGPAVAFILGGMSLWTWGDFWRTRPTDMGIENQNDPRWIGAWWLGFLVCGVFSLFTALPLTMFPQKLKDTDKRKVKDVQRTDASLNQDFSNHKYEFFKIFAMFLCNRTIMCLVLMQTLESMLMNGYITFVPKLIETLFSFSSGASSAITGAMVVPVGVFANFIGGYLSKRFNNQFKHSVYTVICFTIFAGFCSSCLLLQCSSPNLMHVNVNESILSKNDIKNTCSAGCHCDELFNPVCATDIQLSFLSPCHAGCADGENVKFGASNWTNCACASKNGFVEKGFCKSSCTLKMAIFFTMFCIMAFSIFVTGPILQSASVRVVHHEHRDHFLCYGWLWMRILGSIPGAVLFGIIIDQNCLYWQKDCDGSKCQYYDSKNLGFSFFFFTVIVKSTCAVLLYIAAISYKEIKKPDESEESKNSPNECSQDIALKLAKRLSSDVSPDTMVY
ncbi:unnamed protein product [Caenorhabditis bovis]|uniref:Solute carrier organic anion transporter family member n=1 Tax=Caenorhabditis bovis TaxID=2654633 RepID=A0A8S1EJL6_9PELO|nr:unnamed protein product [Caenorhabditis bovis]